MKIINEVATVVSLDFINRKYSDNVSNEYALDFVYHFAMQNYFDRAKAYDGDAFDKTTQYVAFSRNELAEILDVAFGARFNIDNLQPIPGQAPYIVIDSNTFYVSIGETLLINIENISNPDATTAIYNYIVASSIITASGEVTVKVEQNTKNHVGVSIVSIDINEMKRVNEDDENDDNQLLYDEQQDDFLSSDEGIAFQSVTYEAAKALLSADSHGLSGHMVDPAEATRAIRGLTDIFNTLDNMVLLWIPDDMKSETESKASYRYLIKGEDSFWYVSMELIKVNDEWKVKWIGIEK
jgi:hypothetical protein